MEGTAVEKTKTYACVWWLLVVPVLIVLGGIMFAVWRDSKHRETVRAVVALCHIGDEVWKGDSEGGLVHARAVIEELPQGDESWLSIHVHLSAVAGMNIAAVREYSTSNYGNLVPTWVEVKVDQKGMSPVIEVIKIPRKVVIKGVEVVTEPPFLEW